MGFTIAQDSPETGDVQDLLEQHFNLMRATSPEESCHVMEPGALLEAGAVLFALREDGVLLGVGALKEIDPAHAELKSMHTAKAARGRGVARALLGALVEQARAMGCTQISLETGTDDLFAAARQLYAANGFVECPPFGDYRLDPLSIYFTRRL